MKWARCLLTWTMVGLPLAGCTVASVYTPMPQSNFASPNSTVAPLGHVKATVTKSYIVPFQIPNVLDARTQQEAYVKALQGSGGDLIVDGDYTVQFSMIPLLIVAIFTVDGTVEGTAAKLVEVGVRPLR